MSRGDWLRMAVIPDEADAQRRCDQFIRDTAHWQSILERRRMIHEFRATGLAAERDLDRWSDDGGRA